MKPKLLIVLAALLALGILWVVGCSDDTTEPSNTFPEVRAISVNPERIYVNQGTTVSCTGLDPDGDPIAYLWSADAGTFAQPESSQTVWTSPATQGLYRLKCTVSDGTDKRWAFVGISVVTPPQLLARWTMDTDFSDAAGDNEATAGAGTSITNVDFSVGTGSAQFTGVGPDLTGIVTAGTALGMGTDDGFGVTMWIKTTDTFGFLFGRTFDGVYGEGSKGLYVGEEGNLVFWVRRVSDLGGETAVNDDVWHHVAVVKNGLTITLYVDGVQDAEKTFGGWREDGETVVTMGAASNNGGESPGAYTGLLDDVRFYARALTEDEVNAVMNE